MEGTIGGLIYVDGTEVKTVKDRIRSGNRILSQER
jgi:hypothetical protein